MIFAIFYGSQVDNFLQYSLIIATCNVMIDTAEDNSNMTRFYKRRCRISAHMKLQMSPVFWDSKGFQMRNILRQKIRIFESKNF